MLERAFVVWQTIARRLGGVGVGALIALVVFCSLFFIARHHTFPDPDGFYHAKMAQLMFEQGVVYDFPWLPLTILQDVYTNQHLLYHVLLIPFVTMTEATVGLSFAAMVFGTVAMLVYYLMLRSFRVSAPGWWTLFVFFNAAVFFRLSLVKAYPVSLLLLCLGLIALYHRRVWWLALIMTVYVWTYGGWPLLWGIVALLAVTDFFFGRENRFDGLKLFAITTLSAALAFVFNPYFPQSIAFYGRQLVAIALTPSTLYGIGNEWGRYGWQDFVGTHGLLALMVLLVSVYSLICFWQRIPQGFSDSRKRSFHLVLVLSSMVLIFMTLLARRYAEYAVPMATAALAFTFLAFKESGAIRYIREALHEHRQHSPRLAAASLVVVGLILGLYAVKTVVEVRGFFVAAPSAEQYRATSDWMKKNLPAQALVMNLDWGAFPELFLYNDVQVYAMGLDPRLLDDPTGERLKGWQLLYQGMDPEPTTTIQQQFGAPYVLVSTRLKAARQMLEAHNFSLLYRDADAAIYATPK